MASKKFLQITGLGAGIFFMLSAGCSHKPAAPTPTTRSSNSAPEKTETAHSKLRDQAYSYYLLGDYPRAIEHLEAAAHLDAQESWSRFLLFYCYLTTGNYKAALATAEGLARQFPYQPLVYQQVGLAQLWLGQTTIALANLKRALEFESHTTRVHFYVGLAYAQLRQIPDRDKAFHEAELEYLQILKSNPKDFTANFELAALYLNWNRELDKVAPLLTAAREAIVQNPDEDLPPERRVFSTFYLPVQEGIFQFRQGKAREAVQILESARGSAPVGTQADLAEIYYYLGESYALLADRQNAASYFEKVATTDARSPFAGDALASAKKLTVPPPAPVPAPTASPTPVPVPTPAASPTPVPTPSPTSG